MVRHHHPGLTGLSGALQLHRTHDHGAGLAGTDDMVEQHTGLVDHPLDGVELVAVGLELRPETRHLACRTVVAGGDDVVELEVVGVDQTVVALRVALDPGVELLPDFHSLAGGEPGRLTVDLGLAQFLTGFLGPPDRRGGLVHRIDDGLLCGTHETPAEIAGDTAVGELLLRAFGGEVVRSVAPLTLGTDTPFQCCTELPVPVLRRRDQLPHITDVLHVEVPGGLGGHVGQFDDEVAVEPLGNPGCTQIHADALRNLLRDDVLQGSDVRREPLVGLRCFLCLGDLGSHCTGQVGPGPNERLGVRGVAVQQLGVVELLVNALRISVHQFGDGLRGHRLAGVVGDFDGVGDGVGRIRADHGAQRVGGEPGSLLPLPGLHAVCFEGIDRVHERVGLDSSGEVRALGGQVLHRAGGLVPQFLGDVLGQLALERAVLYRVVDPPGPFQLGVGFLCLLLGGDTGLGPGVPVDEAERSDIFVVVLVELRPELLRLGVVTVLAGLLECLHRVA